MKKSNHWLWAGMIVFLMALLAAGCTNEGGTADSDQNNDQTITYKLTLYYPVAIYTDEDTTVACVVEVEGDAAEDGTDVHFVVSDGTVTPDHAKTLGGMTTTQLNVPDAGDMVLAATANNTLISQVISVIEPDEPVEPGIPANISLSSSQAVEDDPTLQLTAIVKDASNAPATDGTLVYFEGCCGTFYPNPAPTTEGLACTTYTPNDIADPTVDTVTVTAGDILGTITITYKGNPNDPGTVTLTPSNSSVVAGSSIIITALVLDGNGRAVPDNSGVTFSNSWGLGQVSPTQAWTKGGLASTVFEPATYLQTFPATVVITAIAGNVVADIPITINTP